MDTDTIIEATELRRRYGDHEAVRGVSMRVGRGELHALLGTNGAGKTTTVETLEGLQEPDGGTVRVFGRDPARDRAAVRPRTGVMLQDGGLSGLLTVAETMRTWRSFTRGARPVTETLELVGLADRADVPVAQLSGGEHRRLELALAVLGRPELLFLDEPTTGMDPASRRRTWDAVGELRRAGTTVLLTTHYLEEAEALADRVTILHAGRIVAEGSPAEVVAALPARITFVRPLLAPPAAAPRRPATSTPTRSATAAATCRPTWPSCSAGPGAPARPSAGSAPAPPRSRTSSSASPPPADRRPDDEHPHHDDDPADPRRARPARRDAPDGAAPAAPQLDGRAGGGRDAAAVRVPARPRPQRRPGDRRARRGRRDGHGRGVLRALPPHRRLRDAPAGGRAQAPARRCPRRPDDPARHRARRPHRVRRAGGAARRVRGARARPAGAGTAVDDARRDRARRGGAGCALGSALRGDPQLGGGAPHDPAVRVGVPRDARRADPRSPWSAPVPALVGSAAAARVDDGAGAQRLARDTAGPAGAAPASVPSGVLVLWLVVAVLAARRLVRWDPRRG